MKTFIFSLFALVSMLASPAAFADSAEIYTSWRSNTAVGGYDVVSFYTGKPVKGDKEIVYHFKNVDWRFSTQANLDLFKTTPETYLPQYGGYCSWALAKNKLAKGSPKHWHVEDGKLYLNFNKIIKKQWDKDRSGFIEKGDANWPEILKD